MTGTPREKVGDVERRDSAEHGTPSEISEELAEGTRRSLEEAEDAEVSAGSLETTESPPDSIIS